MIPLDCFEGQSATGDFVPIVPGGRSIPLTYGNRPEYVSRALDFRLHEMDAQVRDLLGNVTYDGRVLTKVLLGLKRS